MATPDQTIRTLDGLLKNALVAAVEQLKTEATKWVPIDEGDLRQNAETGEFKREGDRASVVVSYDLPYAGVQYFGKKADGSDGPQRHYMPGGLPAPVTSFARPPGMAGARNQYQRSYRAARAAGVMPRFTDGLRWFERAMADGRSRKNVIRVFVGFYR